MGAKRPQDLWRLNFSMDILKVVKEMKINIEELPDELRKRIEEEAASRGCAVEEILLELLKAGLGIGAGLAELAPSRIVSGSGETVDEVIARAAASRVEPPKDESETAAGLVRSFREGED